MNEEDVPPLKLAEAVVPLIVIVNSPCAPPGITTGVELEARAHDNPPSVKALMLTAVLGYRPRVRALSLNSSVNLLTIQDCLLPIAWRNYCGVLKKILTKSATTVSWALVG